MLDDPAEGFDALMAPVMVRPVAGGAEAVIPGGPTRLNIHKGFHGGFLAAAAEKCLFLPLYAHGQVGRDGVVTINFELQYVQQVDPMIDLMARVSLVHQTGRLAFVRGELAQGDKIAVTFSGTLRKLSHASPREASGSGVDRMA